MKNRVFLTLACLCIALSGACAFGYNGQNVYVTNNNYNYNYNTVSVPSQSNIMCTERGGYCTNGHFIMGTRRTIYTPSRSRLKSTRSPRLGLYI